MVPVLVGAPTHWLVHWCFSVSAAGCLVVLWLTLKGCFAWPGPPGSDGPLLGCWGWCSWVSGPGPGAQSALAQLAAGSTCGLISVALGLLHCGCWLLTSALLQVGAAIVLEVVWGGLWMPVAPVTSLPASYPVLVVLCAVQSNL